MKLSAPIYQLKRRAKLLARSSKMTLAEALDQVARDEGFARWSLLAARYSSVAPSGKVLSRLENGDMLLLGARPGHGKTTLGLEIMLDAVVMGRSAHYFTLFHTHLEVDAILKSLAPARDEDRSRIRVSTSDEIGCAYIMRLMSDAAPGSLGLVDYLQLLDGKDGGKSLGEQMTQLADFARRRSVILVFLSQIERSFDPLQKRLPDFDDIRMSDRLAPGTFNRACFLHDGAMDLRAVA
ncbi:DNA helicase [Rhodobacterales bacterium]|nr:DNA helicase [Rhodobacterales bacterium]